MIFTKMHGAGNDYVYVNCFEQKLDNIGQKAKQISDRHFGIGSDGLVLILPSQVADFKMDMYNADGSQGKMCGNAIRCVAKYVYDNKMTSKKEVAIETLSGIKYIKVKTKNDKVTSATVNMGQPILNAKDIPTTFDGEMVVNKNINVACVDVFVTCVSMGNPHCVTFVPNVDDLKLENIGPDFENFKAFPDRINTEFVELVDDNTIKMRVWERGSGETLACGTGACASVVASILCGHCKKDVDIKVILLGGELVIRWDSESNNVFMTGPATTVFTGEIDI
ncbi:MAG: diaminopimelate epimerase [Acutalibacteraceae bacterium]|nr:diaminopimelate epimerase [Clostridiales bacterium]